MPAVVKSREQPNFHASATSSRPLVFASPLSKATVQPPAATLTLLIATGVVLALVSVYA